MKAITIRADEKLLEEFKEVTKLYHENMSELFREFMREHINKQKNTLSYKLKKSTDYISDEEQKEIESQLSKLTSEDLKEVKRIKL